MVEIKTHIYSKHHLNQHYLQGNQLSIIGNQAIIIGDPQKKTIAFIKNKKTASLESKLLYPHTLYSNSSQSKSSHFQTICLIKQFGGNAKNNTALKIRTLVVGT